MGRLRCSLAFLHATWRSAECVRLAARRRDMQYIAAVEDEATRRSLWRARPPDQTCWAGCRRLSPRGPMGARIAGSSRPLGIACGTARAGLACARVPGRLSGHPSRARMRWRPLGSCPGVRGSSRPGAPCEVLSGSPRPGRRRRRRTPTAASVTPPDAEQNVRPAVSTLAEIQALVGVAAERLRSGPRVRAALADGHGRARANTRAAHPSGHDFPRFPLPRSLSSLLPLSPMRP